MAEVTEIRRFKKALNAPYNFSYFYAKVVIEDTDDSVVSVIQSDIVSPIANSEANLLIFSNELANAEAKPVLDWTF